MSITLLRISAALLSGSGDERRRRTDPTLTERSVEVLSYRCPLCDTAAAAGQRKDSAPVHPRGQPRYSHAGRREAMIVLRVPRMTCRHHVRAVTAAVRDLAGVVTLQADAGTASLVVTGPVSERDVRIVLAQIGFAADGEQDRS
jgi:copper chaperone CopZ